MFNLTNMVLRLASEAKGIEEIEEKIIKLVFELERWMFEASQFRRVRGLPAFDTQGSVRDHARL